MDGVESLERLLVALAIGLLIGVERGWMRREDPEGGRTAGLRTFALTGLLGGVVGLLAGRLAGGAVLLGLALLVYGALIGFLRYREMHHDGTYGATTVVAALVTFALGALAAAGEPAAAAAASVATAALLSLKSALHGWLKRLTWEELRAGLILLAMTVVLLPILPDRGMGPWQALNPRELWLMTILIAGVSSVGYVAIKTMGERHGIAASAVAGGLVASTAVTLTYARLARAHPDQERLLSAGAILAGATMMLRVLVVTGLVNVALLPWVLPSLVAGALAMLAAAALLFRHGPSAGAEAHLDLASPFELATVLKFGLLLAVIMLAAKLALAVGGNLGVYALAAASGIADVDAVTISMARLGGASIAPGTAAAAILLTAGVNTIAKSVLAFGAGGRKPGLHVALASAGALATGLAGLALAGPEGLLGRAVAAAIGG
ncbi:MAG: DUF4010 domain-containing protein [Pseudomonadota bacterium]